MKHRYGRHGPQAWLRQQERRGVSKNTTALVPLVYRAVLKVHVFIGNQERFFIVEIPGVEDQRYQDNHHHTTVEGSVEAKMQQIEGDPLAEWKQSANEEAYVKLYDDIAERHEPVENPRADPSLHTYARTKALANRGKIPPECKVQGIDHLVKNYIELFLQGYLDYLQKGREDGSIADVKTQEIQKWARRDLSLNLSYTQLPIYGAIRAVEQYFQREIPDDQLPLLEEKVRAYQREYIANKEAQGSASSEPFSG